MSTDAWGVTNGFGDCLGQWHDTSDASRHAIHAAMGVHGSESPSAGQDAVRVIRQGQSTDVGQGDLRLEDGTVLRVEGHVPHNLPLGYHGFHSSDGNRHIRLIVGPGRCPLPAHARSWGWAAQLYAARSKDSWGMGDLSDLRRLARWSATQQAGLLLINPLVAASPLVPQQASPYYPISRRYRNPLYLRIEEVSGASALGANLERLAAAGRALNSERRIDRDAIFRLKQEALEAIWERFTHDDAFDRYCQQEGAELTRFATFCALAERFQSGWMSWPQSFQDADGASVRQFAAENGRRIKYHQWLQWLLDGQLARASTEIPIVQDLPIGVDPDGADAWAWQDVLAKNVSVGAPPDMYNMAGQDWGLPPFVPHKLRAAGYEPFIQTIRASLKHAGGLRIDHVMGLFRLFWIPRGFGARGGAFVRYPADDLLQIVALESHRTGAFVVGEDLGTVEHGVREKLAEHQILSYRLLWFENNRPSTYSQLSMVAATTHDLPTIAGMWSGADLKAQRSIGIEPSEESAREIRARLASMAGIDEHAPIASVIEQTYRMLAEAPSMMITAMLEDALAVEERANMPGTTSQWPNWSLSLPGGLDALEASPLARAIAAVLHRN
jgi:4-alpha-glucanotransferase